MHTWQFGLKKGITMQHTIPPEVRKTLKLRNRKNLASLPIDLKSPSVSDWLKTPKAFSKTEFIDEFSEWLERVYGMDRAGYIYTLWFLANEMDMYMRAKVAWEESGSALVTCNKQNPLLRVQDIALQNILKLSRELGLTPTSRLMPSKTLEPENYLQKLIPFPSK